ncbi:MAG: glycosyltransferase [Nitrososphaeria archaeon]
MRKVIKQYNHKDSLIIISLYPKKGELYSAATSGVASYAKNIVKNMKRQVVVLADIPDNQIPSPRRSHGFGKASACHRPRCFKADVYEEENTLVIRCFKRNSPLMWFVILKQLLKFNAIKNILVQLDFAMYGGIFTTSLVLPFLAILKIFGYKTNVTMHHVVTDIFKLKGHVGLGNGVLDKIKGLFYNGVFHLFYLLLGLVSNKIVVLEEVLKTKLNSVIPNGKVVVIPHGVDSELTLIPKDVARKELGITNGDFVVLFFGFVNWFKGADFFVDVFGDTQKLLGKKVRFIIAGGKSPTMQDKPFYQKYFASVLEKIYSSKNVSITGYVPQKKIGTYFSAADLVVLPYRHLMTASGVLSLVFSYKKPFIVSRELGEMFEETDFKRAFENTGLKKEDAVFDLDKKFCLSVTENVLKDGLKAKMRNVAQIIRRERDYKNTASLYEKLIFDTAVAPTETPALSYTKVYGQ